MSCLMSRDWFRGRAFADVFFNILIDLPPLSAWLQIIWTAPTIATGFNVRSSTLLVKFAPPAQLQIIWTAPMIAMCFDSCLSITHSASVNWRCFMKYLGCHIILDFMFFNITSFSSAWFFFFSNFYLKVLFNHSRTTTALNLYPLPTFFLFSGNAPTPFHPSLF